MAFKRGRYSWILRPVLIIYDLFIINIFAYNLLSFNSQDLYFFSSDIFNNKYFLYLVYSIIFWPLSTYLLKFYNVYRYTSLLNILSLIVKQFITYGLIIFAFVGVFRSINIQATDTLNYLLYAFVAISIVKLLSYYILKSVRVYLKGNLRNIVVIGSGESVNELKRIFVKKKELGYNIRAVFNNLGDVTSNGSIKDSFEFLNQNDNIDDGAFRQAEAGAGCAGTRCAAQDSPSQSEHSLHRVHQLPPETHGGKVQLNFIPRGDPAWPEALP